MSVRQSATLSVAFALALAAPTAHGQEPAQQPPEPPLQPTQSLDGAEERYQAYPGDPNAIHNEEATFYPCITGVGRSLFEIPGTTVRPNRQDPGHYATVRFKRQILDFPGVCKKQGYAKRTATLALKTKLPGHPWKTSREPVELSDPLTFVHRLDWGQTLHRGETMRVRITHTSTITNMTAGVPEMPVGHQVTLAEQNFNPWRDWRVRRK